MIPEELHTPSRVVKPRVMVVEDDTVIARVLENCVHALACVCVGPFLGLDIAAARTAQLDAALFSVTPDGGVSHVAEVLAERQIPFGFTTCPHSTIDSRWNDRPYLPEPFDLEDVHAVLMKLLRPEHRPS